MPTARAVALKSVPAGRYRARLCVDRADHPQRASLYMVPTRLSTTLYERSPLLQTLGDVGHSVAEFNRRYGRNRHIRRLPMWVQLLPFGVVLIAALVVVIVSTR